MTKITRQNTLWNQVVIEDPHALPGASIYSVIDLLKSKLDIRFVFLDDLVGAGIPLLISEESEPVQEINEFMKNISKVSQFDWGDFFLFKSYPENWVQFTGKKYQEVITATETTVRAVDDAYIYIYTPYNEIIELIEKNYTVESIKIGVLDDLDYPE